MMRLMVTVATLATLATSPLVHADEAAAHKFVNSPRQLHEHFTLHVERVQRLGLTLYDTNPAAFHPVPRYLVSYFLALHDQAKVNQSEEFKRAFWVESILAEPFCDRLYEKYAVPWEAWDAKHCAQLQEVIENLNRTDKRVAEDFFRRHSLIENSGEYNAIAQTLLRIERIADVVDRNSDPVAMEELALRFQRPMSDFLKDEESLEMASRLKTRYREIVVGHRWVDYHCAQALTALAPSATP